jgi:uncharacterized membrane protein YhaH (DUF805 family)
MPRRWRTFASMAVAKVFAFLFLPAISVAERRLHDIDKAGWNYWFTLVAITGPILFPI